MVLKITDGLYAFIWQDYRQNNCNTFLIDAGKYVLVDPGHRHLFEHVERGLAAVQLSPREIDVILATHGHPDHIEAVLGFDRRRTRMGISQTEHAFIAELAGGYMQVPMPDFFLQEGELTIGRESFQVIETPGHSPGSICFYWPRAKALLAGDLVFPQGIGRTDLPGGAPQRLKESILKVRELDVEYLLSGHGDVLAGKAAVQDNFRHIEDYWFNYL